MTATQLLLPTYMRQPNWRWNVALAYTAVPEYSDMHVMSDPYLYAGIRFFREFRSTRNTMLLAKAYPDIFEAFLIYNNGNKPFGFRWFLEAYLMTDKTPQEISAEFNNRLQPQVIQSYAKLFFDVQDLLKDRIAVMATVLGSAMTMERGAQDYDYTWKSLAYEHGLDGMRDFIRFRSGNRLTPYLRAWFREIISDRYLFKAYALSADLRSDFFDQGLAIYNAVQQNWKIQDEQAKTARKGGDEAPKQFLAGIQMILENPDLERAIDTNVDPIEKQTGYDYSLLERVGLRLEPPAEAVTAQGE